LPPGSIHFYKLALAVDNIVICSDIAIWQDDRFPFTSLGLLSF
jgi:hypothetical protein